MHCSTLWIDDIAALKCKHVAVLLCDSDQYVNASAIASKLNEAGVARVVLEHGIHADFILERSHRHFVLRELELLSVK